MSLLEHGARSNKVLTLVADFICHTVQTLAAEVDREDSPYGYIPSKGIALTFIILFGISTCKHCHSLEFGIPCC